jgi:hypothetical protein
MRARYLREANALLEAGAHDVVAEEVESAVEVVARMLRALEVPPEARVRVREELLAEHAR